MNLRVVFNDLIKRVYKYYFKRLFTLDTAGKRMLGAFAFTVPKRQNTVGVLNYDVIPD
jgi:hypothetical protein